LGLEVDVESTGSRARRDRCGDDAHQVGVTGLSRVVKGGVERAVSNIDVASRTNLYAIGANRKRIISGAQYTKKNLKVNFEIYIADRKATTCI